MQSKAELSRWSLTTAAAAVSDKIPSIHLTTDCKKTTGKQLKALLMHGHNNAGLCSFGYNETILTEITLTSGTNYCTADFTRARSFVMTV
jgi:hypothetical protein